MQRVLNAPTRHFLNRCPPLLLLALCWLTAMVLIAVFANWLLPYPYMQIDVTARLQPPVFWGGGWDHILGTDQLGRDILARTLVSIRISITIALCATLITTVIGLCLGFSAAYLRGAWDAFVMMLVDAQLAMPFMIIAIAVMAFMGSSLTIFILLLGFHGWESITRIARGLAISANGRGYVVAVRDLGAGPRRIYLRHILPNISATIAVAMTLNLPGVIMLESSLSFLGIGLQPPYTSLGNMVGYGRDYIQSAPWIMLVPSAVIVLTALSFSIVGDWARDRMDPTLR